MNKKELNKRFKEVMCIYHSPVEYNSNDPYWFIQSEEVVMDCIEMGWEYETKELLGIIASNIYTLGVDTVANELERILRTNDGITFRDENEETCEMLALLVDVLKEDYVKFFTLNEGEYYSVRFYGKDFTFDTVEDLAKFFNNEILRGKCHSIIKTSKREADFDRAIGVATINALGCIANINGSAKLSNKLYDALDCSNIYTPECFVEDELVYDTSTGIIGMVCMEEEAYKNDCSSLLVKIYERGIESQVAYQRIPIISCDYYELDDQKRLDILKMLDEFRIRELINKLDK